EEAQLSGPVPCIHHWGIEVEDRDSYVAKIKANGGTIISKPGEGALKFRAPDGTVAEIVGAGRYEKKAEKEPARPAGHSPEEPPPVHRAARRRGGRVAARGAGAATGKIAFRWGACVCVISTPVCGCFLARTACTRVFGRPEHQGRVPLYRWAKRPRRGVC